MRNCTVAKDSQSVAESRRRPINTRPILWERDIVVYESLHKDLKSLITREPEVQEAFVTILRILTAKFPEHKSTREDYRIWAEENPFIYIFPETSGLVLWVKKQRANLRDHKKMFDNPAYSGLEFHSAQFRTAAEAQKLAEYVIANMTLT